MAKPLPKHKRLLLLEQNIRYLKEHGFNPTVQPGCWFHYKDGPWNFYPTTGKYYNEDTKESGLIAELTSKPCLPRLNKRKYYNLDRRYLPDWVLAPERQEWLAKFLKS